MKLSKVRIITNGSEPVGTAGYLEFVPYTNVPSGNRICHQIAFDIDGYPLKFSVVNYNPVAINTFSGVLAAIGGQILPFIINTPSGTYAGSLRVHDDGTKILYVNEYLGTWSEGTLTSSDTFTDTATVL